MGTVGTSRIWAAATAAVAGLTLSVLAAAPTSAASATPAGGDTGTGARQATGQLSVTVTGTRFGKPAKVRLQGLSGPARGSSKSVRVRKKRLVRGLKPARYRVTAAAIRKGERTAVATERPRRVRVGAANNAAVTVTYRTAAQGLSDLNLTEDGEIGRLALDGPSTNIATSADGTISYVSVRSGFKVARVDMSGDLPAVLNTFAANSPRGLAVSRDLSALYFADLDIDGNGVLERRNATNGVSLGRPIRVGAKPEGVVISPDGSRVYVANSGSRSVSVVDTATARVVATIPVSTNPTALALSPDGTRLYVAAASLNVIDTASNTVAATIPLPGAATGVTVASDGRRVYVTSNRVLYYVDPATNAIVDRTRLAGTLTTAVRLSPDDARAYVTIGGTASRDLNVQVVDVVAQRVAGEIRDVPGASGIAFRADGRLALVTQAEGDYATVVGMADRAAKPAGVDVAGTPVIGQTLTAIPGIVASVPVPPAVTYQWQSSAGADAAFSDISGQQLPTYTVQPGDAGRFLRVELTAENGSGKQSVVSVPVGIPAPPTTAPPTTAPPTTAPPTTAPPTTAPPIIDPGTGSQVGPAPRVRVRAAAVARKSRLKVQVSPSLGATNSWGFRVQKKSGKKWKTLGKPYSTRSSRQIRIIDLKRGKYRAVVAAAYGYAGATSSAVKLKR
jgi:YVTN family beta-propeller protein